MNISSGSVFGPVQPQHVPGFNAPDNNNFNAFSPSDYGGGSQAISYGNNVPGGTDFNSLSGLPGTSGSNGQMNDMQFANQLANALMPMLMQLSQIYQMLQQLFAAAQQQQGSNAGAGGNSGGGAGGAGAFPQGDAGQQPLTAQNNAAQPAPAATPQQPGTAPANTPAPATANTTPQQPAATPDGGSTPTSGVSATQGKSGMHLPEPLKRFEADIMRASKETGIQPEILAAQIWQESRGKVDAVTVNGGNGLSDSGVMQVNSNTFADLQSKNPHLLGPNASPSNASDSIMAGALYMKEQKEAFGGDIGAALRAYNSGPGNVNVNDLTDISKTGTGDSTYVGKVLNFADIISSGKGTLPA